MAEMIGLAILAVIGWLAFLRERAIAGIYERTLKSLNEAIEFKDKTIFLLKERHSDLANRAQHVIDLHDNGLLSKLGKDSNAIEILRIHARSDA